MKAIFSFLLVILVLGGFLFLHFRGKKLTREFHDKEINSFIVKESDWQKRSITFYLENGMILNVVAPARDRLQVGDIIKKSPKTFIYSIYRKNSTGKYEVVAIRDYRNNN